jgi:hypothetical protein
MGIHPQRMTDYIYTTSSVLQALLKANVMSFYNIVTAYLLKNAHSKQQHP